MKLCGSNINKFLISSQKNAFLIFSEMELFYILGNGNPPKFQERYVQNPSITELSYISGKIYSEPWHI